MTVSPVNDSTSEPTETVILTVVTNSQYTVGSPASATVSIFDNDAQYVSVETIHDAVEGGTYGVFRFTRIGDLSGALTANVTIGGTATLGTDYTGPATAVQFAVGSPTADVSVGAIHDGINDPDETVTLTVASGSGSRLPARWCATHRSCSSMRRRPRSTRNRKRPCSRRSMRPWPAAP